MKIYLLLIGIIFSCNVMAQNVDTNLTKKNLLVKEYIERNQKRDLASLKAIIHRPSEYPINYDYPPSFDCRVDAIGNSPTFGFIKADSSVVITIALQGRDSSSYKEFQEFASTRPDLKIKDPDDMWKMRFKSYADTVNHKYHYYTAKELINLNADGGVEFSMTCRGAYLDNYKISKAVLLNKKYLGIIEIYYFVRQGAKVDIDKEVKNNSKMIVYLQ